MKNRTAWLKRFFTCEIQRQSNLCPRAGGKNLIFFRTAVNRLRNCENVARFENHRFYPPFFRRHPKTGLDSISPKRKAPKKPSHIRKKLLRRKLSHASYIKNTLEIAPKVHSFKLTCNFRFV